MTDLLLAFGLVLVLEGLVFALAPLRIEDLLKLMATISPDRRRQIGLFAVALGVGLVALARWFGG